MKMGNRVFLVVLVALGVFFCAEASIIEVRNTIESKSMITAREGMFASNEVPTAPFLHGYPSITIDVSASFRQKGQNGTLWALVYPDSRVKDVGVKIKGKYYFCCTDEVLKDHKCIKNMPYTTSLHVLKRSGKINDEKHTLNVEVRYPLQTALYHVSIISCDSFKDKMDINGEVTFRNPYGFLPGSEFGYLPFYAILGVQFIVLLFWWLSLCFYHRKVLALQLAIAALVIISLVEMVIGFFSKLYWNTNGSPLYVGVFLRIAISILRKTSVRVLVVIVSLGYGVVRKKLPGLYWILLSILGLLYFIAAAILELVEDVSIGFLNIPNIFKLIAIFPVSLLDSIFYWCVFISVNDVIKKLRRRQHGDKYVMYKKWVAVLVLALCVALFLLLFQLYINWAYTEEETWQINWSFDACWEIFFFLTLVAIMIIWRPTSDNTRLAYSDELNIDDDDSDGTFVSMPPQFASDTTRRRKGPGDIEMTPIDEENANESFLINEAEDEDTASLLPARQTSEQEGAETMKIGKKLQHTKVKDLPKTIAREMKKGIQQSFTVDTEEDVEYIKVDETIKKD